MIYCLVGFGDGRRRWYRAGDALRPGTRVIAPVPGGLWKIGAVLAVRYVRAQDAPVPPERTAGIVGRAGPFAEGCVTAHNRALQKAPVPRPSVSRAARKEQKRREREREDRELDDQLFFMELMDDLDYDI